MMKMNNFRGDLSGISAKITLLAVSTTPAVQAHGTFFLGTIYQESLPFDLGLRRALDLRPESCNKRTQCFFFGRNIGWVTPKTIYFHYLKKYFLDQNIQKIIKFNLIYKAEALNVQRWFRHYLMNLLLDPEN